MTSLLDDVNDGLSMWRQHPGLMASAVLTLALGIGANAAIFSVVHATLLRTVPFPDAYRLMTIWQGGIDNPEDPNILCWPNVEDVQAGVGSLASRALFELVGASATAAMTTSPSRCRQDT